MSQLVETTIDIDGTLIKQFSSLNLSQGIFAHHTFKVVCPAEAVDGRSNELFAVSRNLIGLPIYIKVKSLQQKASLAFFGVVTKVEAVRRNGHNGDIVISGYSPTILLDNGPHCKTWERKAIKNILQDVLKQFPPGLLKHKIAPASRETIAYTVQYKETAWQFINRLAGAYGEWLYYDGQKLLVGIPKKDKTVLQYGTGLSSFTMSMQVKPPNVHLLGYDYLNHEVYNGISQDIAGCAGLDDLGKHAFEKSTALYTMQPKQYHNHFLRDKKQLDDLVNIQAAMQNSDVIRFNGVSDMPGMQPGAMITVKGRNMYDQQRELYGDFTIVSIDHFCDGQGNYTNHFTAVPASLKFPPVTPFAEPRCETQSALVVENNDVKGLGRVRVKFHWMTNEERTPWLRMTMPHAGDGKGIFIMPEIGEEVIVAFEGDNSAKPYVIGTVFHGKAKAAFASSNNHIKAIQTRSGNKIVMNDQEGSIQVEDKDGNHVKMDGSGNIKVISNNSMTFECGESKIEIRKDGVISITGKTIDISSSGNTAINANATVAVKGSLITLN
jgi:type VI secretion system secreted protein VgrG